MSKHLSNQPTPSSARPKNVATRPRTSRPAVAAAAALVLSVTAIAALASASAESAVVTTLCVSGLGIFALAMIVSRQALVHEITDERHSTARLRQKLDRATSMIDMSERIDRAFLVCDTATEVLRSAGTLANTITGGYSARILIATPNARSLLWQIRLGETNGQVEPLRTPVTCVALRTRRGESTFDSSMPGACHHLSLDSPSSAACLVIPGARQVIGILEIEGPIGQPPDEDQLSQLQQVANRLGQRLASLGTTLINDSGDATDPLTGLPLKDEVFRKVPEILRQSPTTSFAIAEIDDWEGFTEVHGPKAASAALRMVGSTLADALRPGDAITRIADARFLLVLPRCGAVNAHRAMERVRERLILAAAESRNERLTLSIGIADTETETDFDSLLASAEAGAADARDRGGNRALIGS